MDSIDKFLETRRLPRYDNQQFLNFLKKNKFEFSIPVIHVSATNGKGSIVNYLQAIYLGAGYQVGTFTSPHLNYLEMIKVNNQPINPEQFRAIFEQYQNEFIKHDLSEFEIQTFIALEFLKSRQVDLAIIEVGMGGLIDATNVVESTILSIIGRVSMEHAGYLGRSESEIAANKAGIIKPYKPTLSIRQDEGVNYAIKEAAKHQRSQLHYVIESHHHHLINQQWHFDYLPLHDLVINSSAEYQIENACVALEAVNILSGQFPVSIENIRTGLEQKQLCGRFTILPEFPRILLDGAHNPAAIEKLMAAIQQISLPINEVLFAAFRDKNVEKMLSIISAVVPRITLTTFPNPRAREETDYFLFLEDFDFQADYQQSIHNYLDNQVNDGYLLVTGSLDFVYRVVAYLKGLKHEKN